MEAILDFVEWIGDILWGLWETVTNIGEFLTGAITSIKTAIEIPVAALDIVNNLADFFPVYVWAPVLALISLVMIFRVLKIVLSGG